METYGTMAFLMMLVFSFMVPSSTEGCFPVPSLSLSLFPRDQRPSNHSALKCQLCPNSDSNSWQEHTFVYILNGNLKHLIKRHDTNTLCTLSNTKNFYGLWQCRVKEYPHLIAEYYLGPPASDPPATTEDASNDESFVPAYTVPPRLIVTIVTAAVLLIILIIVTAVTSSACLLTYYRKRSTVRQHVRASQKSNSSLTDHTNLNASSINVDAGTEVSYVELDIPQKPPPKRQLRPSDTVYANIM